MTQTANWCFTLYVNPHLFSTNLNAFLGTKRDKIRYICGQVEQCPNTGQYHFQGYLQLFKRARLATVKRILEDNTVHLEAQKARSSDTARDYTRKEESRFSDWVEAGEYIPTGVGKGKRNDVTDFKDAIKDGKTIRELIDIFPNEIAKFPRLYHTVRALFTPKRPENYIHRVTLCYGDPGTGKSKWAREQDDIYIQPLTNGTNWYDGYDIHVTALLDDFAGKMSKMSLTTTLQLLDRYPIQVPVKGGFTWWMPEHVIITTNIHPRGWYEWNDREIHWKALCRRITCVRIFNGIDQEQELYESTEDVMMFLHDTELWPRVTNINHDESNPYGY